MKIMIMKTPRLASFQFSMKAIQRIILFVIGMSILGCTPNEPWRTDPPCSSPSCDQSFLVHHPDYDLAFVEFTERGNVFNRSHMKTVVDHVAKLARTENGVAAVVFVHGWKNNAEVNNPTVADFRDLFQEAAKKLNNKRRMVGIYVGWRGLSVWLPAIRELSYWERKTAAEQIGKGGVTELLLELEHAVSDDGDPNKNLFIVTGHSFGAGIVLSALNEILLERVTNAPRDERSCVETRPFGHGVVLLNPAIEANEAFQLKEAVAKQCFGPNQVRLMHVISSDADRATNRAFRVGQWLAMLQWKEADLDRTLIGKPGRVDEHDLNTFTVGNYLPFQTGQLCDGRKSEEDQRPECRLNGRPDHCVRRSKRGDWNYISYAGRRECVPADDRQHHIHVKPNEPLAFIQTDDAFIGDHNNVFTNTVVAYLAAIVDEARFKRTRSVGRSPRKNDYRDGCVKETDNIDKTDLDFDFGGCFHAYEVLFENQ